MNYMLYKQAEGDEKGGDAKSARHRALMQAVGAVGGGTLGYLMTRYGMGIKGAGAQLVGTGLGAVAGAGAGNYMADYGKHKEKKDEEIAAIIAENKRKLNESRGETLLRNAKNPLYAGTAAVYGLKRGFDKGVIESVRTSQAERIAGEMAGATKDTAKSIGESHRPKVGGAVGGMTKDVANQVRKNLKEVGAGRHATDALTTATTGGGRYANDLLSKLKIRSKRAGTFGSVAGIGLPVAATIIERLLANPSRAARLETLSRGK